jgi:hypothetical protein
MSHSAAHRHRAARAHAVACKLARINPVPAADGIGGTHAEDQLAQRCVHKLRDRRVRPPVMRLAVADEPAFGRDLHHHGVALYRAADAERHVLSGRNGVGRRVGLHVLDAQILVG